MANPGSYIEEMLAAGRGILALLTGDRKASAYFDLGLRGLAGSLIAFLAVEAILAYAPALFGAGQGGSTGSDLMLSLVVAAIPVGIVWLALRMMGRPDSFVPFLVADFWASAYLTLGGVLLLLLGAPYMLVMMGLAIVVVVVEVNIARLIVTLAPMQVAALIIAQLAGGLIGLLLWGAMLGGPAETGAVPT